MTVVFKNHCVIAEGDDFHCKDVRLDDQLAEFQRLQLSIDQVDWVIEA